MNLADLNTWLDYHYWARDLILDAVAPLSAGSSAPIEAASSRGAIRSCTYGASGFGTAVDWRSVSVDAEYDTGLTSPQSEGVARSRSGPAL
jgi:hypothetical protein